jgi:hypothetical protein
VAALFDQLFYCGSLADRLDAGNEILGFTPTGRRHSLVLLIIQYDLVAAASLDLVGNLVIRHAELKQLWSGTGTGVIASSPSQVLHAHPRLDIF